MKNLITFLLALSICVSASSQKGGKTNSRWNNYVTNPDAIPQSDFQFFKKGNLYYLTSNDDQNYYIDMRVEDTETEARILREGFVVWISTNNKTAKNKGVRYPIGTENTKRLGMRGAAQTESGVPKGPLAQANTVELIGFSENESRMLPSDNTDNIRGSVRYNDQGVLYYRLIIPLSKLGLEPAKSGDGTMPFSLGIETGAQVIGMMGPGMRPGGGPPSGGIPAGSGGRSGGGGGRPGGGAMPPVNSQSPNPVLWIKDLELAVN
jgi:hypothetical protein